MTGETLSIIIITKNEEETIVDCLESAKWAGELIIVDSGSTDKTLSIAKKYKCKVINYPSQKKEFSKWRNKGLAEAKGKWVFYLDADERVTPELREEILRLVRQPDCEGASAYFLPRRNYYLGYEIKHGGAWPDYVKRLFRKEKLEKWVGDLHEEPVFSGEFGYLTNPLLHYTHRDLTSMLRKTIEWSKVEAELLYKANHPKMVWWRFIRIIMTEFWYRGIKLQGWRDGTVGWIEIIFQCFSRFITYGRLWELQQK